MIYFLVLVSHLSQNICFDFFSIFCRQENNTNTFNEETLRKYFQKYGDIESIKLVSKDGTTIYAYVTFQSDESAYAAITEYDVQIKNKFKCVYNIQPADTWKQPSSKQSNNSKELNKTENDPKIFKLNEDCFEALLQYLDVESQKNLRVVSKKYNTLVSDHGFKQVKTINKLLGICPLAAVRRKLILADKHINEVALIYEKTIFHQRLFEILYKYLNTNIRSADLVIQIPDLHTISLMKQLFENLTSLGIYEVFRNKYNLDVRIFQELSPNLKKYKFKSYGNVNFARFENPWPKLEYLSIGTNFNFGMSSFRRFLKLHSQVKTLKLNVNNTRINCIVQIVVANLPNLQRFSIDISGILLENLIKLFDDLSELKNLTKLSVINYDLGVFM